MYEHAIPQNIMEYEFKLFAGLTLKQFIYVALTGLASFTIYQLSVRDLFPPFFAWILIPIILLVGLTLGLGSLNKRTMEDWLTSFVRANNVPLRRVWKKDQKPVEHDLFFETRPHVMPAYLAVYFMNQDEYKQLMDKTFGKDVPQAQTPLPVMTATTTPAVKEVIDITPETVVDYAEPGVTLPAIPNTVAFKLQEDGIPVEGVVSYVKDSTMSVIAALRSNADGIIYFNQGFKDGVYELEFQSPEAANFPKVMLHFQGNTYPLINLSPTA